MFLLDASVWVILGDPEDRYYLSTRRMIGDLSHPVGALDLTLYEVANVVGRRWGRADDARGIARLLQMRCRDRLIAVDAELVDSALDLAAEYGLTAYDAAYVAAARHHDWSLVSTDIADLVSKGLAVTPDAADYP